MHCVAVKDSDAVGPVAQVSGGDRLLLAVVACCIQVRAGVGSPICLVSEQHAYSKPYSRAILTAVRLSGASSFALTR
jgi:hypothetical protein